MTQHQPPPQEQYEQHLINYMKQCKQINIPPLNDKEKQIIIDTLKQYYNQKGSH